LTYAVLIQTTSILAANLMGLITREWQDGGGRFRAGMAAGLALLCTGIAIVSGSAFV
jgi:hypothetical protein